MYNNVREKIERSNASYQAKSSKHKKKVIFQPRNLVWVYLRKDRFPQKRRSKLSSRADGPFEILERINNNAYRVEVPGEYGFQPPLL